MMNTRPPLALLRPIILCTAILSLAACNLPSDTATRGAALVSGTFSDGEILQVLHVLNNGEINQAQSAARNSDNRPLREAAQMILDDHSNSNERILEIVEEAGIELEQSPLSRGMNLQANTILEGLEEYSGRSFECQYLEKQVEQHRIALETVRNELQPDAFHDDVRELLSDTTESLRRHMAAAQQAHDSINCS